MKEVVNYTYSITYKEKWPNSTSFTCIHYHTAQPVSSSKRGDRAAQRKTARTRQSHRVDYPPLAQATGFVGLLGLWVSCEVSAQYLPRIHRQECHGIQDDWDACRAAQGQRDATVSLWLGWPQPSALGVHVQQSFHSVCGVGCRDGGSFPTREGLSPGESRGPLRQGCHSGPCPGASLPNTRQAVEAEAQTWPEAEGGSCTGTDKTPPRRTSSLPNASGEPLRLAQRMRLGDQEEQPRQVRTVEGLQATCGLLGCRSSAHRSESARRKSDSICASAGRPVFSTYHSRARFFRTQGQLRPRKHSRQRTLEGFLPRDVQRSGPHFQDTLQHDLLESNQPKTIGSNSSPLSRWAGRSSFQNPMFPASPRGIETAFTNFWSNIGSRYGALGTFARTSPDLKRHHKDGKRARSVFWAQDQSRE